MQIHITFGMLGDEIFEEFVVSEVGVTEIEVKLVCESDDELLKRIIHLYDLFNNVL